MKKKVGALLFALFVLAACASVQDSWQKLTPNEQARIIINGFQTTAETMFDMGKNYVTLHPEYLPEWKKTIPMFDAVNKSIIVGINMCAAGDATPEWAYSNIGPTIKAIQAILTAMGVK